MSRLKKIYAEKLLPELSKKYGCNIHEIAKIEKIVINMGVGEASREKKVIDSATTDLTLISGQKAVVTKAKKSVASFKIRDGMPIGTKVTLRGNRMYEFLDRLINIALPRVRDFAGYSKKSFDGSGNFTFGIKEHIVFPEIDYDKVDKIRGMDITIVTSSNDNERAYELLSLFNFPFVERKEVA